MDLIVFCLEVLGGLFLGAVVFSVVIVPLFHGLPLSLYWSLKGRLRFSSTTRYVFAPVIWFFFFMVFGFALFFFFPSLGNYLAQSNALTGGYLAGFFLTLFRAFSSSGRTDLREDFWSAMEKYRR